MGVIALASPNRRVPWRPIAVLAIIVLLATATLVLVGSRPRVPPPFGLAANGALLVGTVDGDIATVDPKTGKTTILVGGPTVDGGPFFANDGQHFVFDRRVSTSDPAFKLYIANADGSDARELFTAGADVGWLDWSPTGDHVLITPTIAGKGTISIVNLADRTATKLDLDLDVAAATWRPNHDQLVVTAKAGDNRTFWLVNADGSGKRPIPASEYAINEPTLSPDGTRLAYATWDPVVQGRIHVVGIDTGGDHSITPGVGNEFVWQNPWFSPDGAHLLVLRFKSGTLQSQQAVISADGQGPRIAMGPTSENSPPTAIYSPDGTKILVTYETLGTTWLFDADGSNGHEMPLTSLRGQTWQRRAP